MAAFPNLRKLFATSRSESEERHYSRTAFFNFILFITSIAAFSLISQKTTVIRSIAGSGNNSS